MIISCIYLNFSVTNPTLGTSETPGIGFQVIHWCSYWPIINVCIIIINVRLEAWWTTSFRCSQITFVLFGQMVIISNARIPRRAMIFTQTLRWDVISETLIGILSWHMYAYSLVINQGISLNIIEKSYCFVNWSVSFIISERFLG